MHNFVKPFAAAAASLAVLSAAAPVQAQTMIPRPEAATRDWVTSVVTAGAEKCGVSQNDMIQAMQETPTFTGTLLRHDATGGIGALFSKGDKVTVVASSELGQPARVEAMNADPNCARRDAQLSSEAAAIQAVLAYYAAPSQTVPLPTVPSTPSHSLADYLPRGASAPTTPPPAAPAATPASNFPALRDFVNRSGNKTSGDLPDMPTATDIAKNTPTTHAFVAALAQRHAITPDQARDVVVNAPAFSNMQLGPDGKLSVMTRVPATGAQGSMAVLEMTAPARVDALIAQSRQPGIEGARASVALAVGVTAAKTAAQELQQQTPAAVAQSFQGPARPPADLAAAAKAAMGEAAGQKYLNIVSAGAEACKVPFAAMHTQFMNSPAFQKIQQHKATGNYVVLTQTPATGEYLRTPLTNVATAIPALEAMVAKGGESCLNNYPALAANRAAMSTAQRMGIKLTP